MTDPDVILSKVSAILAELNEDPYILVTFETRFWDLADWDSIKHIEAIVSAEEAFDVSIPMRELHAIETIGDLVRVVGACLPGTA